MISSLKKTKLYKYEHQRKYYRLVEQFLISIFKPQNKNSECINC